MAGDSPTAPAGPVVVALGGNTLLGDADAWTMAEQRAVVEETAERLAGPIRAGHDIVLTHGNGPQVGNRLLEQERVAETPDRPLDVLVAETQAQIGYLLQSALADVLPADTDVVTVVTRTVVDPADPAFDDPTKPVGPAYTEAEAAETDFRTRRTGSGERPYRRVVPSPDPRAVLEAEEIGHLLDSGKLPICAGGGGVPVARSEGGPVARSEDGTVARSEDGTVARSEDGPGARSGDGPGVEAVVDKDRTSQVLGSELGARTLLFLTDVEYAYLDFGSPEQRPIEAIAAEDLREHLAAGEFAAGSMRPKVEACLDFVEAGGERAIVTSPAHLQDALAGEHGTIVTGKSDE